MDIKFTLRTSAYILPALFLITTAFTSCSTQLREEEGRQESANTTTQAAAPKQNPVTIAAIEKTSDEVYFDLIAETDQCLGENLWLGGKLESTDKVVLSDTGAFSKVKEFVVTELTATGLNSNNLYQVNNSNLLQAKYDEGGIIYLQLNTTQMQLRSYAKAEPIVVAYQPQAEESYFDGSLSNWRCN